MKWMSNSREVMTLLPVEDLSPSIRMLDCSSDALLLQGAMGLLWDPEDYVLAVGVKKNIAPLMKHGILQRTHLNFDPLGFS